MKRPTGFTLIELMIAVAIAGILAFIALPAYQQHILKSNRADAIETLATTATTLERQFTNTNSYQGLALPTQSTNNNYSITAVVTATTFTLTATAKGKQSKDTECATFSLDQAGVKTATTAGACW